MESIVREAVKKIEPYVPGKPIEEVKRELGLKDVMKLASNENAFGPSPKAVSAIKQALKDLNRYPDASAFYLKKKLAKLLKVKTENIIVSNGSDEIIVLCCRAFLEPGDEVIISDPTFLIYRIAAQSQGAKIKFVPLKNMKYDLMAKKKAITKKTKIIFIANPDNPTGSFVTRKEVEAFLKGIRSDILVFFDEAYKEFAEYSQGKVYPDTLRHLDRKNVIITRSFSKAYGLAGIRIGYGVSSATIINYLERLREPFNVNSLAQAAAIAALDDKKFLRKTLKAVETGKRFICKNLDEMGLDYVKSAANFILINVKTDGQQIFKKLLKKGVIVRGMDVWGLKNYIRVTIGTMDENKKFIKELRGALK